jgi:P27 family predicted phage terminase small subunit
MGAGRPAKPTHLKLLAGNPGKRALPKNEPKPKRGVPRPPSWLSKEARKHWKEVSAELDLMGVLTTADAQALALFCDALSEYVAARHEVLTVGATYSSETESGGLIVRPNPAVAMASDAWRRLKSMATEFGLTPASRSKVGGAGKELPANPWEALKGSGGA